VLYGIEVLWNYVLLLYGEGKTILEEDDQIERTRGIDYPA
jgi:hypothetical protein